MKYITYTVLSLLFLLPFILSSFLGGFAIHVAILLCLIGLLVLMRSRDQIMMTFTNKVLLIYLAISALFLPFSLLPFRSISLFVWLVVFVSIFIFSQGLVKEEKTLLFLSKIFVILTTIFGIFSISKFIDIGLTSYTRLDGIIGTHNVYGGFLILPLILSIYLIFQPAGRWEKRLWFLSSAILLSSMVLTFSRGTWLSLVLAAIFSVIVFYKRGLSRQAPSINSGQARDKYPLLKTLVIFLALSFVIFCGIWYMARETTLSKNTMGVVDTAIYPMQNAEENAVIARLHYFQDAGKTFIQAPIVGFGSGMYAQALRMFKTDPSYGSFADPHNWFLKMLVENGFVVTIIFTIFIISLFWKMAEMIKRKKEFSLLIIAIFTALLASTIHGLMDFDWSVNLLLVVFFVFAGSLYGYLLHNDDQKDLIVRYFPFWFNYLLAVLVIIFAIISIQFLRADLVRARGDVQYFNFKDSDGAINSYFESITRNSHEPLTWYNLWRVYYNNEKFGPAKNCIKKALELFPEAGMYWGALARTEEKLGEMDNYHESLLKAIKYFPASDLSYHVKLVEYDFKQKKYDEAMYFIDRVLPIYSKYEKLLWYKNDPNSPVISENLVILRDYKKKISEAN